MSRTATASAPHTPTKVWLGAFAIGAVLLALPFVLGATAGQGWIRILNFALLYVMLALGLNIVVGLPACSIWATSLFMPWAPIRGRCWLRRILICTCLFGWYCPLVLPWPLWQA